LSALSEKRKEKKARDLISFVLYARKLTHVLILSLVRSYRFLKNISGFIQQL